MTATFTTNLSLKKPSTADRQWDIPLNANADLLDSLAPIGGLVVTSTEQPSISLNCRISRGTYLRTDGTVESFNGTNPLELPSNTTTCVWLEANGIASIGQTYPSSPHLRLAQVETTSTNISRLVDQRIAYQEVVVNPVYIAKTGDTMTGPLQISAPSGNAVFSVDPLLQTLSFFGIQNTRQAAGINPISNVSGGTSSNTIADVGASYSQQVLNNNFASLASQINLLLSALRSYGLIST